MAKSEDSKERDNWDRADVVGKLMIPIVIAMATFWFDASRKSSDAKQKTLEVAIDVLKAPKSPETEQLRNWALDIFRRETGTASAELPKGAVEELQQGAPLPSASQLPLPDPGGLRISIIRQQGSAADASEKLKSDLMTAGYTDITTDERPQKLFPDNAEVRFYYSADRLNAKTLSAYISDQLHIRNEPRDKSKDQDASRHRPGELHVYIK